MIKLTNIKQQNKIISVDVESKETNPHQKYNLMFDLDTESYRATISNPDRFDVLKIIHKLNSYIEEGKKLPTIDCIACY